MFAGMAVLLILAAFGVQLLFCFLAGKRWVRWLPTAAIFAGMLICAAAFAVCVWMEEAGNGLYGGAFAAYLYGLMLLMALAGALAAWLIRAIAGYMKIQRK